MKLFKGLAALMLLTLAFALASCEKDEPGSNSSHDYYTALVSSDPDYYWVIDMDHKDGAGYDGSFKIIAWTLDGKKKSGMPSYSGKYQTNGSTIYVTWNHQSMNTQWRFTSYGIEMFGSSNPEELEYLTFYDGAPDFE